MAEQVLPSPDLQKKDVHRRQVLLAGGLATALTVLLISGGQPAYEWAASLFGQSANNAVAAEVAPAVPADKEIQAETEFNPLDYLHVHIEGGVDVHGNPLTSPDIDLNIIHWVDKNGWQPDETGLWVQDPNKGGWDKSPFSMDGWRYAADQELSNGYPLDPENIYIHDKNFWLSGKTPINLPTEEEVGLGYWEAGVEVARIILTDSKGNKRVAIPVQVFLVTNQTEEINILRQIEKEGHFALVSCYGLSMINRNDRLVFEFRYEDSPRAVSSK